MSEEKDNPSISWGQFSLNAVSLGVNGFTASINCISTVMAVLVIDTSIGTLKGNILHGKAKIGESNLDALNAEVEALMSQVNAIASELTGMDNWADVSKSNINAIKTLVAALNNKV